MRDGSPFAGYLRAGEAENLEAGRLQPSIADPVAKTNTEEFIAKYGGAPKLPGQAKIRTAENV